MTVAYGIPSIKRDGHSYLTGTLQSLIQGLTEEDKDEVVLIVFIGDVSLFVRLLCSLYSTYELLKQMI